MYYYIEGSKSTLIKACTATPQITAWLQKSAVRKWKAGLDNPNCLFSNYGEALYIYEDHVCFWEDIRDSANYTKHDVPDSESKLQFIV